MLTNNNTDLDLDNLDQNYEGQDDVFRSMKINQESKTPYSDATQVRLNTTTFKKATNTYSGITFVHF